MKTRTSLQLRWRVHYCLTCVRPADAWTIGTLPTEIGLGVLAIPSVFQALGLLPGMVILVAVACMTTCACWIMPLWDPNDIN